MTRGGYRTNRRRSRSCIMAGRFELRLDRVQYAPLIFEIYYRNKYLCTLESRIRLITWKYLTRIGSNVYC